MVITQQQLRRAIPDINGKGLDAFVASFNMNAVFFCIDNPLRVVHYLAQVIYESDFLKSTVENLNYSADGLLKTFPKYFDSKTAAEYARKPEKIANRVYANRMGNGGEASGDGWKYRGRGYIMLTGKENYSKFNMYDLCSENVLSNPDKVAEYPLNQVSSMWFWEKNGLNAIADDDDVKTITKKINGGFNGLSTRQFLVRRLKKEYGIKAM